MIRAGFTCDPRVIRVGSTCAARDIRARSALESCKIRVGCAQGFAGLRSEASPSATISSKSLRQNPPLDRVAVRKGKPLQNNVDIAALFNRHAATVYRLCYSFLGSAADAEDATQSVFMKLIDRPRRFNDAEHEKAWLIVCAQNHCRDVLKSAHRTRQTALPEDIADERRARQDETLDAVLALPEKYKTCVYLFYYEGYRTAEIAALTGVPSSTVRSHLSEARALLKTMLGGERHGR